MFRCRRKDQSQSGANSGCCWQSLFAALHLKMLLISWQPGRLYGHNSKSRTRRTENMSEDAEKDDSQAERPNIWDSYFQKFLAAIPPVDPSTRDSAEQALKSLTELAHRVPESLSNAIKTMVELLQEVTNIKGVDVQLKSFRSLDLKMHIMREADIPVNRDIAGIGKIEAIRLSKLIHMQAEIGEDNRDVRAHFHEGLSLVVSIMFLSGKQVLPLKGTAKLIRDARGQIMVESTSYVPGTDMPVTFSFPLKQILDEVRKSYKL